MNGLMKITLFKKALSIHKPQIRVPFTLFLFQQNPQAMLIFKNETVTHRYHPEVNAATSVWYGFRKERAYNEGLHAMLSLIEDRHVNSWVAVLNKESEFPMSPDSWAHESWINDAARRGLQKIVIVCTPDWVSSDTSVNGITIHFCSSIEEARSWVNGQA
jgi:hypothetical protein